MPAFFPIILYQIVMQLFDNTLGSIFLTASLQGVMVGIILVVGPNHHTLASRLLGLLTVLFSLDIFYYVFVWSKWHLVWPQLSAFAEPLPYLYGPILYAYITQPARDRLYPRDLIHLVPCLMAVAYYFPFYILPVSEKLEFLKTYSPNKEHNSIKFIIFQLVYWCKPISLIIYTLLTWRYYSRHQDQNRRLAKEVSHKQVWLQRIMLLFILFTSSVVIYYILVLTGLLVPALDYTIAVVMAVCIYTITYYGFHQPKIFEASFYHEREKYEKTGLTDGYREKIKQKLLSLMELEKPYLKGDLKIQELADHLGVSSHQLSQVINREFGQTFTDFINHFRVEASKEKLLNPEYRQDKLLKIALESGFNNKVTFHLTFKKMTGLSPADFRARYMATDNW